MPNSSFRVAIAAAALIVAACGSTPTTKSTGEYFDDAAITVKVKAAFVEDKQVKANDIAVDTYKGTVQLSGFADNRAEIDRAVQVASNIAGVKAVRNEIQLKPAGN